MAKQTDIVIKASQFVSALFDERLPNFLVYHTIDHTIRVAKTTRKIGKAMMLGEEGIEVVTLAGWFHDTGYIELYRGHEEVSVRIAQEFLEQEGYPKEKIELVCGCISATKIPQQPHNLLEEIVADADLAGLGRKSFFDDSQLLLTEWEKEFDKTYSEQEWTENNINLLSGHKYFTSYAKEKYSRKHSENLQQLHQQLREINSFDDVFVSKHEYDTDSVPNIESFIPHSDRESEFEDISDLYVKEAAATDQKANMMTMTNVVIISICILTLVISKLGVNQVRGMIPIFLLALNSIVSALYSALAAKQNISDEATESGSSHRKILSKKYRYLNRSYSIFIYGLGVALSSIIVYYLVRLLSCVIR